MRPEEDPGSVCRSLGVSCETAERLGRYVALLRRWQPAQNLVSAATLDQVWTRHIADSAQVVPLAPAARIWLDLGSGAGFPGLVIAILVAERGGTVHLVESNQRKCAFLRAVARDTGAPTTVHCGRIDSVLERWSAPVDIVTARALAPLADLCRMSAPLIARGARALFHKGQDFDVELAEATKSWKIDMVKHASRVQADSWIIEIRGLTRR